MAVYFKTPEDARRAAAEKVTVDGNTLRMKWMGVGQFMRQSRHLRFVLVFFVFVISDQIDQMNRVWKMLYIFIDCSVPWVESGKQMLSYL